MGRPRALASAGGCVSLELKGSLGETLMEAPSAEDDASQRGLTVANERNTPTASGHPPFKLERKSWNQKSSLRRRPRR